MRHAPTLWVAFCNCSAGFVGDGTTCITDDMVRVPALGNTVSYEMGRPVRDTWGQDDEQPAHLVTLTAFEIDRFEVTASDDAACVAAGACAEPMDGPHPTYGMPGREDHPINHVTWVDASQYCAWVGKRLPTEAEWELAARGQDPQRDPWGNLCAMSSYPEQCEGADWTPMTALMNCINDNCSDDNLTTTPVGSFPGGVSPYGAMDMAGNVWEWTSDWYDADFYASSPVVDPVPPQRTDAKVFRGGSFASTFQRSRVYDRWFNTVNYAHETLGFRCVR